MNPVNRNETVATKLAELDRDIETSRQVMFSPSATRSRKIHDEGA